MGKGSSLQGIGVGVREFEDLTHENVFRVHQIGISVLVSGTGYWWRGARWALPGPDRIGQAVGRLSVF